MRPVIEKICQIIKSTTDYTSKYPFFCRGLSNFQIVQTDSYKYALKFESLDETFYLKEITGEEEKALKRVLEEYTQRKFDWIQQQFLNYGID